MRKGQPARISRAAPWAASARSRPDDAATPLTAPSPYATQTTSAPLPTAPLCVRIAAVAPPATPTGPSTDRIIGIVSWLGTPAMARAGLQGASAEMVLLVTAGVPSQDTMPMIRSVLGPVGVAGGATAAILTHNGAVGSGALAVREAHDERA